jgi:hypothetical protein
VEPPRDPLNASLAAFLEHLRIGWHPDHLHLQGPTSPGVELGDAVVHLRVEIGNQPSPNPRTRSNSWALAANDDWRVWPLRRLGPRPDPVKVDVFAVIAHLVVGPDCERSLLHLPPVQRLAGNLS